MTTLRSAVQYLPGIIAIVAVVCGAASPSSAAATETIRVALLPMVVHSAERPEYLREGLSDMLSSRLEQVDGIELVRVEESDQATSRLSKALKYGRKEEVDFVLFGSFTRFGQGASLDIQCASTREDDTRAPLREIFVHSGSIGDVIPDLDDLVGKVARFIDTGVPAGQVAADSNPSAGGESENSVDELRDRVQALEDALAKLQGAAPGAVAAPSTGPELPLTK